MEPGSSAPFAVLHHMVHGKSGNGQFLWGPLSLEALSTCLFCSMVNPALNVSIQITFSMHRYIHSKKLHGQELNSTFLNSKCAVLIVTFYSQIKEKRLNVFHMRCLRRILGIAWQDRVTNKVVLERLGYQAYTLS